MKTTKFPRDPDNLQSTIWRYMDLTKFIYLLETNKLYLARADKFDDHHEGAVTLAQKETESLQSPEHSYVISQQRKTQREWTFISCWSLNEHESHALWRIFSGPKEGIAIRTTYEKLVETMPNVEDCEVGIVEYGDSYRVYANTLWPFFQKRKAFEYESEVRLVANIFRCFDVRDQNGEFLEPKACLTRPLVLSHFIEKIRMHPESGNAYKHVVKSVINKFAPELNGRLEESELSTPPIF